MQHTWRWPARSLAIAIGAISLTLVSGGAWLLSLGGSSYYVLAGVICALVASGLWRGRLFPGPVFASFLVATMIWSILECGLAPWPLVARLAGPAVIGIAIAVVTPPGTYRLASLGAALACCALILASFLLPHPETISGTAPAVAEAEVPASANWPSYANDTGGTHFSPLADIRPENIAHLQRAWVYRASSSPGAIAFEATPLVSDGLLTFCTGYNDVIALDAATGTERWRFRANVDTRRVKVTRCRGVARYVVPGAHGPCATRILMATVDARLIALDALDGTPCSGFGSGGTVDLARGLGPVADGYYFVTSAPAIVRGKAVIGGGVLDNQSRGEPSGVIRAFDAVTGKLAWAWDMARPDRHAEPPPGERYTPGTPNSWAPISADEALGLVYLPIGNATPDLFAAQRSAVEERYASSVVALDAETGTERWHFQTTHHDIWDYDVSSQPALLDLATPGGAVPAVVQATKRGEIFLLDRRTGKPLADIAERPVPTGAAARERPAPTQPFSVGMPSLAGPPLDEASMWGLTPIDQLWCRIAFRRANYLGPMTPVGLNSTIIYPGASGGINWGGVSIDPVRQIMTYNTNRLASYDRLMPRREKSTALWRGAWPGGGSSEQGMVPMRGSPYAADVELFFSPLQIPCQQPPFGMIGAISLTTRKIIWQHPFGTTAGSGPRGARIGLPLPMGVPNVGGSLVTASGLLFIGASQDGYLRALSTRDGTEIWRDHLPAGGQATPMTYKLRGGRQFVVIAVGGYESLSKKTGDTIVAYALSR